MGISVAGKSIPKLSVCLISIIEIFNALSENKLHFSLFPPKVDLGSEEVLKSVCNPQCVMSSTHGPRHMMTNDEGHSRS